MRVHLSAPTDITEEHRQEDQAVQRPKQHNAQIHAEVENLEQL